MSNDETDAEIVRRSLDEPATFGAIFDRHAVEIHRYVARRTDATVADDVVAQVFLVAFERRASFDLQRPHALPWLYGIATNLLRRHRRDEARMLRALQRSAEPEDHPDSADRVAERVDADTALSRLASSLRTMPRAQRDALLLHAWADLTYEQIAEATEVPVGTVRSRLNRARAALRGLPGPTAPTPVTTTRSS
jgi:RNA polymerase sigma factor (sigma-70 family)